MRLGFGGGFRFGGWVFSGATTKNRKRIRLEKGGKDRTLEKRELQPESEVGSWTENPVRKDEGWKRGVGIQL